MTKNIAIAAIALVASAFATGCATGAVDCSDVDCSAYDVANAEIANDLEVQPSEDGRVTAHEARDPQLRRFPITIAPLQDWVLRMEAGQADACDFRFAGYVAGEHQDLSVRGCEESIISEIFTVEDDGRVIVPIDSFNAEETKWMLLGLDLGQDNPLTVEQVQLLAEAHDATIAKKSPIHAEAYGGSLQPAFGAEDLAPKNF